MVMTMTGLNTLRYGKTIRHSKERSDGIVLLTIALCKREIHRARRKGPETAPFLSNSTVLWAAQNGITTGTGNGKFSPNAECTRGQIVTLLYRANN